MAVVGSASVVVRFITAGAASQLKRDLTGLSTASRSAGGSVGQSFMQGFTAGTDQGIFKRLGNGFKSIEGPATAARERLQSLIRIGNFVGPALIGVVGAVGALGGALITLVGVLSAAVPALAAVGGGFVTLGIAAIGAKIGLSGVGAAVAASTKQNSALGKSIATIREELQQLKFDSEGAANGERRAALNLEKARENLIRLQDLPPNSRARREALLAYDEAELAFKRAKDQNSDLQQQLEDGITPASAGTDPFAGLNESQKALAQYLVSLEPLFESLENRISKGFIPSLIAGFGRIENEVLRTKEFEDAIDKFGEALGRAGNNFFNGIMDNGGGDAVISLLNQMSVDGGTIEKLGTILGDVFGIFIQLMEGAQPTIQRLFGDLETGTGAALTNLKGLNESGNLANTFDGSYTILKRLTDILGLFVAGFGALGKAATEGGAGGMLLDFLESVGTAFAGLGDNEEFKAVLEGATANGIILLQLIGDILGGILDIGARPEVGDFFQDLRDLGPKFGSLFDGLLEGLPGLSELVGNLLDIGNALQASGAISAFFDTLNLISGVIADILNSEGVQNFVGFLFPILQVFNAIGLSATLLLNFALLPIIGVILSFLGPLALVKKTFEVLGLKSPFGFIGKALKGIGRALLFVGGLIKTVLLGAFALVKTIVISIGTAIRVAFSANPIGFIITVIGLLVAALGYFFTQTELGKEIWAKFSAFIVDLIKNIGDFFVGLGENIGESFGRTVEFIKGLWEGFTGFINDAITNVTNFFKDGWDKAVEVFKDVFGGITEFFTNLVNGWIGLVEDFINFFINGLNRMIGLANGGLGFLGDLIGKELAISLIPNITIPRLAKGGIALPRAGGQMVTVAEAGRPERIEPLDRNGLSKRDRVLISELSGGNRSGMTNTINVYASPGMDPKELAEEVSRRLAFKVGKGRF